MILFPRLSPAKQLAELSIRARLSKAKSDKERVLLRAKRMREEMNLPPHPALEGW
jgi:hypothetical protein